jgi:hypothetical protein
MRILLILLLAFLLPGCNFPRETADYGSTPVSDTPGSNQPCYYSWATQSLPELSAQVQAAMEAANLTGIRVIAEAYGENCYDSQTNLPVHFSAMETDFRVSIEVSTLSDTDLLGNLLEQILNVLDEFPPEMTPGPQPGYIGVRFVLGEEEINLWFTELDGKTARMQGIHGVDLFEELQK